MSSPDDAAALRSPAPPGPQGVPLVGVLPRIWRDPLRFFDEVALECGDVARVGLGKFTLYLVSGPALIDAILLDPEGRYWKGDGLAAAQQVMGRGLATSEGDLWRRQRRLMQRPFHHGRVGALAPQTAALTREMLARWRGRGDVDVAAEMSHLLMRAICRSMFGADVDEAEAERLGRAVGTANAYIDHCAWRLVPVPPSFPTPRNVRFRRALATLDRQVYGLIEARRRAPEARDDLLGLLLGARDEDTGEGMSDAQVRDEIITLFIAGHETPANALAWTFYLLARHPEVAARVAEEARSVLGDRDPTPEDLPRLDLAERVAKEAMRLYPPAWVIVRTPHDDVELGGYAVPKGAPLLMSPWVVHRHPEHWDAPGRFDPERWTPDRAAGRHRSAYFPFGGGHRICIGNAMAMVLLKTIVATVTRACRLELAPGRRVVPQPLTTLRPRGGIRARPVFADGDRA